MDNNDPLSTLTPREVRFLCWLVAAASVLFIFRAMVPAAMWIFQATTPFLIALVLAYVLYPVVGLVQHRLHLGRIMGILTLVLMVAAILAGVLLWIIPLLYEQVTSAVQEIGAHADGVIKQLMARHLDTQAQQKLIDALRSRGAALAQEALSAAKTIAGGIFTGLGAVAGGVGWLVGLLATTAFVVVITFYLLLEIDAIPRVIRKLLPAGQRERAWDILLKVDRAVGGFLRGQLLICLCVGVLTMILLISIGMWRYALLVGTFAGAVNFIPYLGPVTAATPALVWVLTNQGMHSWSERGAYVGAVVAGMAAIQMIEGFILQPLLMGKNANLHPLAVMLALIVGATGGIGGMIIAVPIACIVKVLWVELYWKKRPDPDPGPAPEKAE
ncbi:MAG: AI-2E family transporter [bacterium]|nr:AI-2E family transporter [bacterium]